MSHPPSWFSALSFSTPIEFKTLRNNRFQIPASSGVYVFTNYDFDLEKNTGVLYVGKANDLRKRLNAYLLDPSLMPLFARPDSRYPNGRFNTSLRHPGKANLLTELQQRWDWPSTGIFLRWTLSNQAKQLESDLIHYLEPAFNTSENE